MTSPPSPPAPQTSSPAAPAPTSASPPPPPLVALVLQSKKGLQHGEQLCARAHDVTRGAARAALDVRALEAKVRWVAAGVGVQLKVAAGAARSIAEQRARLAEEAKVWDRVRTQHQDALDTTLDLLGAQRVPPSFHRSALEASLFGLPSDGGADAPHPAARAKWKTLRDFVDERGIEDVLEALEDERTALDDTLAATAAHPRTIAALGAQIRGTMAGSLARLQGRGAPAPALDVLDAPLVRDVAALLAAQERASAGMAAHLESLAAHYEQMATALKEKEAGETLAEEDMEVFVRDTAELPSIIAELEEAVAAIEAVYREILETKGRLQLALGTQSRVLDSLDSLGDRMDAMLKQQTGIEMETQATYETLNNYLETLHTLRATYETYQMSYHALVLEMDRRRRYRDSMHAVMDEMRARLDALREDEIAARDAFYAAHSASIPDDLCLAISNLPQAYVIASAAALDDRSRAGSESPASEVLPEIDEDLLAEAQRKVHTAAAQARDVQDALEMPVRPRPRREDSL